ncbi:hypothetical protein D9756_005738 [Leucocoprinus leucothites]|uniref:Uncharacterized protein n=1 Tax=Leucocoprinus leucothites TaxID=201217 RepID=A0A8H5G021_9AGAR|nr:hypothetical protein D9756_005738 [Leucoagaricus leucothites]
MLRTAVFYITVAAIVFVVFNALSPTSFYNQRLSNMSTSPSGWHSRAATYPHSFTPERSALKLAVLRNAPVEHEGFTLALFDSPANIAVDAAGKVLVVEDVDFRGLLSLADEIKDLPETGAFGNRWVIMQPTTSQPIERLLLPDETPEGQGLKETSVQGYDGVKIQLKKAVGDYQHLPSTLYDLVGAALEAREGADEDRDESMINEVKAILGNVF